MKIIEKIDNADQINIIHNALEKLDNGNYADAYKELGHSTHSLKAGACAS